MQEKEAVMRAARWRKVFVISDEENMDFDVDHETMIENELNLRRAEWEAHETIDLSRLQPLGMYNAQITTDDVIRAIRRFKNKKSPGHSLIKKEDLVQLPFIAINHLIQIFNACMSAGYFPMKFKHAIMVFIPKPEKNLKHAMNYRPISLLEAPGKVLERLIVERFICYLEDNGLYDENQYGYRSQRGAQQAIAVTWEQVATALAANGNATLVLRDLEKAYDKVWHSGVKHRLLEIRTPDLLLRILCHFLDGRTAAIRMGNYVGPSFPLLSGVAQVSVISPTLFVTYTSDTPRNPLLERELHGTRR